MLRFLLKLASNEIDEGVSRNTRSSTHREVHVDRRLDHSPFG